MEIKVVMEKEVYESDMHKMFESLSDEKKEAIVKEAFKEWFASDNFREKSTGSYSSTKELTSKGEFVNDIVKTLKKDLDKYYEDVILSEEDIVKVKDECVDHIRKNIGNITAHAMSRSITDKIFQDRDQLKWDIVSEIRQSNQY